MDTCTTVTSHVPLIVSGASIRSETIQTPVTHLTIQHCVEDLSARKEPVGIRESHPDFADFGKGIISTVVDINRQSYSARTEDWHYIETVDVTLSKRTFELYDLNNDPFENTNTATSHGNLMARFHRRITDFIESNQTPNQPVEQRVLSKQEEQELARRLKDLGYD